MALLEILTVLDPRVREIALPIEKVDRNLRTLMDNMVETACDVDAAGLAAIQVGENKRVIVVQLENEITGSNPLIMANPAIQWASPQTQVNEEGCYTIPGPYAKIRRPLELKVSYLDENNQHQVLMAKGLLAHCIHHEIEHLNGILFIDHLSALKRQLILQKFIKNKRLLK